MRNVDLRPRGTQTKPLRRTRTPITRNHCATFSDLQSLRPAVRARSLRQPSYANAGGARCEVRNRIGHASDHTFTIPHKSIIHFNFLGRRVIFMFSPKGISWCMADTLIPRLHVLTLFYHGEPTPQPPLHMSYLTPTINHQHHSPVLPFTSPQSSPPANLPHPLALAPSPFLADADSPRMFNRKKCHRHAHNLRSIGTLPPHSNGTRTTHALRRVDEEEDAEDGEEGCVLRVER